MRSAIIAAAILALGAAGAVSPAQATIITQLAQGDYANDTANVTFQQAHIVPGEYLSSVTMTISAEGSGGAQVTPDDGFPVYLDFQMSVGITVNGPGIPFKQPFYTDYFDLLSSMDLSGEVYESWAGGYLDFRTADVSPTEGYAGYIGSGLVNIPVSVSEDSDTCYAYSASVECFRNFAWTLRLTYDIGGSPRPVAEPSSLLLLASGLGLFGQVWHRSARRTAKGL